MLVKAPRLRWNQSIWMSVISFAEAIQNTFCNISLGEEANSGRALQKSTTIYLLGLERDSYVKTLGYFANMDLTRVHFV
jgi:hypothetical protein